MNKYRIWSKLINKWVTDLSLINLTDDNFTLNDVFQNRNLVFQQNMGILDINKKEIYEGDRVEYSFKMDEHGEVEKHIGEIYYDIIICAFCLDRSFEWTFLDGCLIYKSFKIIGNVYENSELLK